MFKKKLAILFSLSLILSMAACGESANNTVTSSTSADNEPEVIIKEVEVIKEVPIEVIKEVEIVKEVPFVSTATTTMNKEAIIVDTTSDYNNSFKNSVDIKGREAVYLSQPRFFEGNGGTIWTSDDTSIAIVDEAGLVTAINEGTTTIRCTDEDGNQKASYNIYCTTKNDGKDITTYTEFKDDMIWEYYNYRSYEELQAKISTIRDVMKLITTRGMYYDSNAPILADYYYTWAMTGQEFLTYNRGVCCDVANLATYLLQYDYEEIGWIYHHGSRIGHAYNYVYEDGYYYVFDLTDVICNNGQNSSSFPIYKLESLSDFAPEALRSVGDNKNYLLGIIAVNSLNHTEQPANYLSYIHDDSVIFKEKVQVGFEEDIPVEIIYINPDAEGLFEYISIPHEDIPAKVPSWFRDVDYDRSQWNLY